MSRILLAAEANRIQDLIFRSSRLREVTGGSDALEEFWRGAASLAEGDGTRAQVLVHAGGKLRVVFEGDAAALRAERFARDLADLYAMRIGGRLSVATWVENGECDDVVLWRQAGRRLAERTAAGSEPAASPGLPYVQPCTSCGVEPAATFAAEDGAEVCHACNARRAGRDPFRNRFMALLHPATGTEGAANRRAEVPEAPAGMGGLADLPSELEVGALDGRRRVAYLLADGNGFGTLFREAAGEGLQAIETLSAAVSRAGTLALAAATRRLLHNLPESSRPRRTVGAVSDDPLGPLSPVLPLITGGDDVFALIPAPWAFWFAQEFAKEFVAHLREKAQRVVTVSCALVFCKETFPYRFAHEVGETALAAAKRVARARTGGSVVRAVELRSTLSDAAHGLPGEYGVFALDEGGPLLSVAVLTAARKALASPGRKRRHQIEALFADEDRGSSDWAARVDWLLRREGEPHEPGGTPGSLRASLQDLAGGSATLVCAPLLARPGEAEAPVSAAVDLLHLWDYLAIPAAPEGFR